ncbi:hypothetical protein ABPG72_012583 [Tetrahymena utriculariae]
MIGTYVFLRITHLLLQQGALEKANCFLFSRIFLSQIFTQFLFVRNILVPLRFFYKNHQKFQHHTKEIKYSTCYLFKHIIGIVSPSFIHTLYFNRAHRCTKVLECLRRIGIYFSLLILGIEQQLSDELCNKDSLENLYNFRASDIVSNGNYLFSQCKPPLTFFFSYSSTAEQKIDPFYKCY